MRKCTGYFVLFVIALAASAILADDQFFGEYDKTVGTFNFHLNSKARLRIGLDDSQKENYRTVYGWISENALKADKGISLQLSETDRGYLIETFDTILAELEEQIQVVFGSVKHIFQGQLMNQDDDLPVQRLRTLYYFRTMKLMSGLFFRVSMRTSILLLKGILDQVPIVSFDVMWFALGSLLDDLNVCFLDELMSARVLLSSKSTALDPLNQVKSKPLKDMENLLYSQFLRSNYQTTNSFEHFHGRVAALLRKMGHLNLDEMTLTLFSLQISELISSDRLLGLFQPLVERFPKMKTSFPRRSIKSMNEQEEDQWMNMSLFFYGQTSYAFKEWNANFKSFSPFSTNSAQAVSDLATFWSSILVDQGLFHAFVGPNFVLMQLGHYVNKVSRIASPWREMQGLIDLLSDLRFLKRQTLNEERLQLEQSLTSLPKRRDLVRETKLPTESNKQESNNEGSGPVISHEKEPTKLKGPYVPKVKEKTIPTAQKPRERKVTITSKEKYISLPERVLLPPHDIAISPCQGTDAKQFKLYRNFYAIALTAFPDMKNPPADEISVTVIDDKQMNVLCRVFRQIGGQTSFDEFTKLLPSLEVNYSLKSGIGKMTAIQGIFNKRLDNQAHSNGGNLFRFSDVTKFFDDIGIRPEYFHF